MSDACVLGVRADKVFSYENIYQNVFSKYSWEIEGMKYYDRPFPYLSHFPSASALEVGEHLALARTQFVQARMCVVSLLLSELKAAVLGKLFSSNRLS
jgi:hypothetical protein